MDGAWPASGITVENGKETYVYDAHGGGTRSKLTFIIYLRLAHAWGSWRVMDGSEVSWGESKIVMVGL